MSIHLGEFMNKLKVLKDPEDRRRLYVKYNTPALVKFYKIVQSDFKYRDAVKNRPSVYDDFPYGCTRTNLYRELSRLDIFIIGKGGDHIPDAKIIELWDKLLLSLHQDESQILTKIVNGSFDIPNKFTGEVDWVVQNLPYIKQY